MSISVALCTYNGSAHLEEQLFSIARQTRKPDEVVVSDDGSQDRTLAIVAEVAQATGLPVSILAPGSRRGVTANFARALNATTGDLVALCDQDDVWHESHLADLAARLEEDESLLLVHSDARMVEANGSPSGATLFAALRVRRRELRMIRAGHAFDVFIRRNLVTGATTMLRRSLVTRAAPFPSSWVHDEWLGIVAATRDGVDVIDRPLTDYRQHGANQIGAAMLTRRDLVGRLVRSPADRYQRLAAKWSDLAARAESLGLTAAQARRVREKAAFELSRADDPSSRLGRLGRLLVRLVRGEYRRFASQGSLDVFRDLLASRQ
jgi:glycosyltransferase involved in cell wall biosynthesis